MVKSRCKQVMPGDWRNVVSEANKRACQHNLHTHSGLSLFTRPTSIPIPIPSHSLPCTLVFHISPRRHSLSPLPDICPHISQLLLITRPIQSFTRITTCCDVAVLRNVQFQSLFSGNGDSLGIVAAAGDNVVGNKQSRGQQGSKGTPSRRIRSGATRFDNISPIRSQRRSNFQALLCRLLA